MASNKLNLGKRDDGTYAFRAEREEELRHRIEVLNRKVRKTGHGGLDLEVVARELPEVVVEGAKRVVPVVVVRVVGEVPHVAGHRFIARIEHHGDLGNIVTKAPNALAEEVPAGLRTCSQRCDHCKTDRRRNDTFILRTPAGELAQIGRNCLADFLGNPSAADALKLWSLLDSIAGLFGGDMEDGESGGGGAFGYTSVTEFLAATASCIRNEGWVSKATARDHEVVSTAARALFVTGPCPSAPSASDWKWLQPNGNDVEEAGEVVEWAAELGERPELSDYLHSLRVACALGYVEHRNAGLVASAVIARRKELELDIERRKRAERPVGKHVGQVGKRQEFASLTVVRVNYTQNDWGTKTIVALEDSDGNDLVWFASGNKDFAAGQVVSGKATVKKHGDYKGRPQTELSRCVFEVVGRNAA